MVCRNCGCKNGKNSIYCSKCGIKLSEEEDRDSIKEKKHWYAYVAGCLLSIVLFVAVAFCIFRFVKDHRDTAKKNLEIALNQKLETKDIKGNGNEADGDTEAEPDPQETSEPDDITAEADAKKDNSKANAEDNDEIPEKKKQKYLFKKFNRYVKVKEYDSGTYFECIFAYINDDNIPELILDNSGDGSGTMLLCLKKGKIVESSIWSRGPITYKEKGNEIHVDSQYWNSDENGIIFEVGHIEKNKYYVDKYLQETHYTDINGNETGGYNSINNHDVSKEEFDREIEDYRNQEDLKSLSPMYYNMDEAYENLEKYPLDASKVYSNKALTSIKNKKNNDQEDYILTGSDSEIVKKRDLKDLSAKELTYARNEIYARHGYVFQSAELNKYFSKKNWYKADAAYDGTLKTIESENAEFIKNYQTLHGLDYNPDSESNDFADNSENKSGVSSGQKMRIETFIKDYSVGDCLCQICGMFFPEFDFNYNQFRTSVAAMNSLSDESEYNWASEEQQVEYDLYDRRLWDYSLYKTAIKEKQKELFGTGELEFSETFDDWSVYKITYDKKFIANTVGDWGDNTCDYYITDITKSKNSYQIIILLKDGWYDNEIGDVVPKDYCDFELTLKPSGETFMITNAKLKNRYHE